MASKITINTITSCDNSKAIPPPQPSEEEINQVFAVCLSAVRRLSEAREFLELIRVTFHCVNPKSLCQSKFFLEITTVISLPRQDKITVRYEYESKDLPRYKNLIEELTADGLVSHLRTVMWEHAGILKIQLEEYIKTVNAISLAI